MIFNNKNFKLHPLICCGRDGGGPGESDTSDAGGGVGGGGVGEGGGSEGGFMGLGIGNPGSYGGTNADPTGLGGQEGPAEESGWWGSVMDDLADNLPGFLSNAFGKMIDIGLPNLNPAFGLANLGLRLSTGKTVGQHLAGMLTERGLSMPEATGMIDSIAGSVQEGTAGMEGAEVDNWLAQNQTSILDNAVSAATVASQAQEQEYANQMSGLQIAATPAPVDGVPAERAMNQIYVPKRNALQSLAQGSVVNPTSSFVANQYADTLGRQSPDEEGQQFWTQAINNQNNPVNRGNLPTALMNAANPRRV